MSHDTTGPAAPTTGKRPSPPSAAQVADGAAILQVLPALGSQGGVERGTIDVAAAVGAAGGRAVVASSGGPQVHALKRARALHVELPLASKNPLVMVANISRLKRLIKRQAIAVVHARSRAPAWSAFHAARRTGVPFVTTFHGTYNEGLPFKRRYNSVMARGDRVIAISRFIAEHVRQVYGVSDDRIRIIPRGIDVEAFNPAKVSHERVIRLAGRLRLTDGLPVIMLPGRLTRWKGQTVFIEAIARLGRRDICCLLLGSAQGRQDYHHMLETLIARRGLGGVFRIVEDCDDMPAAYMLADVVVSASTDPEAFGRVLVEAQALGRLVIGSDHGGSRETVIPGRTGWLTPPGDADALAVAIGEALKTPLSTRMRMSEAAMAHVRSQFTKDEMCRRTIAVYDEVLSGAAAPPLPSREAPR